MNAVVGDFLAHVAGIPNDGSLGGAIDFQRRLFRRPARRPVALPSRHIAQVKAVLPAGGFARLQVSGFNQPVDLRHRQAGMRRHFTH